MWSRGKVLFENWADAVAVDALAPSGNRSSADMIHVLTIGSLVLIISPVSEGSGDVMVLRRSRPPPPARNGVNVITQKPRDGLFSNLVYTLVVIVS